MGGRIKKRFLKIRFNKKLRMKNITETKNIYTCLSGNENIQQNIRLNNKRFKPIGKLFSNTFQYSLQERKKTSGKENRNSFQIEVDDEIKKFISSGQYFEDSVDDSVGESTEDSVEEFVGENGNMIIHPKKAEKKSDDIEYLRKIQLETNEKEKEKREKRIEKNLKKQVKKEEEFKRIKDKIEMENKEKKKIFKQINKNNKNVINEEFLKTEEFLDSVTNRLPNEILDKLENMSCREGIRWKGITFYGKKIDENDFIVTELIYRKTEMLGNSITRKEFSKIINGIPQYRKSNITVVDNIEQLKEEISPQEKIPKEESPKEISQKQEIKEIRLFCKYYLSNNCKNKACRFAHTIDEFNPSVCKFGKNCRHISNKENPCMNIHLNETKEEILKRLKPNTNINTNPKTNTTHTPKPVPIQVKETQPIKYVEAKKAPWCSEKIQQTKNNLLDLIQEEKNKIVSKQEIKNVESQPKMGMVVDHISDETRTRAFNILSNEEARKTMIVKTKLCNLHMKNNCNRRTCNFAHSFNEMSSCLFGDKCKFRYNKTKACHFRHNNETSLDYMRRLNILIPKHMI